MKKLIIIFLWMFFAFAANAQKDPVIDKIITLGTTDNKVMEHMDYLSNRFGDRLLGSDNYKSACVWAVNTMKSWGMMAEMQEVGELPVGFNKGPWFGKMITPNEVTLDFGTPAYTAGTKGRQKGRVALLPADEKEFWKVRDSIKGAWILIEGVNSGWPRDRGGESGMTKLIREAGALGTIQLATFPIRLLYNKVDSWDNIPTLPDIKLIDKQYNEIKKLVLEGKKVELEFDIRNYFRPGPIKYYNVIGWIPGTEKPDEYVILGGHLDGLAGATAAVDNASGATVAMEVARLILAADGKPKRTIMVHLWAGEEFGLLGSTEWVKQNPDKLPRISAVFNRDGGTNCISGLAVSKAMMSDFQQLVKPILGLKPKYPFELTERVRPLRKGGRGSTDTFSFLQNDVPAFGFSTKGEHVYNRTWHTTLDTYNEVIPAYQEYSAMVTSVIAYGVANLNHLLPREGNFLKDGIYADFNTNKGRISVLLDYKKAPMTVANFVGLAEGTITNATYKPGMPFYSGSIWHRVVKGHVIQGGEPSTVKDPASSEVSSTGYEIPNEITELSHNKAGMLGMANSGPNTNTCQYYITLADRSYLDGNYTLFGEVVDGMDVVNKIVKGDTTFSITIVRAGSEAEKFIVNDPILKDLVEKQWRKVNYEKLFRDAQNEKFISDNYPGLTSLPNGLRYKVMFQGVGNIATDGSVLNVTYTGQMIDGLKFASSAEGGNPFPGSKPVMFNYTLGKDKLMTGLKEMLKEMKQGEKRLIVIPPDLAFGVNSGYYGKEIAGQKRFVISPGEYLILEVTLNKIASPRQ
jgi:cyclophilin family peptidyl-prolyl cis-trans isomerase/FKBP-type peptidyl-prolyl cis-trans isomerase